MLGRGPDWWSLLPDVRWHNVDLGNVPSWLGSIFTGGALIFAFAGWNAERGERRRVRFRERRAQAQLVSAAPEESRTGRRSTDDRVEIAIDVMAINLSQEPVSSCFLAAAIYMDDPSKEAVWQEIPRTGLGVLPPHADPPRRARFTFWVPADADGEPLPYTFDASIRFIDSSGVAWQRRSAGGPLEVAG
jgi:hypothetical protein